MAVVVQMSAWLAAQQVRGETVGDRWVRRLVGLGLEVSLDGPRAVDGHWLELDDRALAVFARGGTVVADDVVVAGDTDAVGAAAPDAPGDVVRVGVRRVDDAARLRAVEDAELAVAVARHEAAGVRFVGGAPFLGPEVVLAPGCTVWGGAVLLGRTTVAGGAVVHPGAHLVDAVVGEGAEIRPGTVAHGAVVGAGVRVGPMAHLRPGTVLAPGARVGNFVETKHARLGPGAKANHLTYLGDVEVGAGANVGAGTITCNYDGARKHPTTIGAGAFVGTHASLVAPVRVGDGALVAAGSVITEDVPDGALAVGRGPQTTVAGKGAAILARNRAAKEAEGDG